MNKSTSNKHQDIVPLAVTSLVAIVLAGVAVIVSANTQLPSNTLSYDMVSLSAFDTAPEEQHASMFEQNAKLMLLSLPHYNVSSESSTSGFINGQAGLRSMNSSAPSVNVNTFLLSTRMSNQSRLSELQMQVLVGDVDVHQFANSAAKPTHGYAGIGFPHIETNKRAKSGRYKPYKQLLSMRSGAHGSVVPNVACMGLSPEKVAKRAEKYDAKIFELAVQHRVSVSLVKAVVAKESCYDPKARSVVGAIGLMQLMPATAAWLKVSKPENVNQNLNGGVRYLAQLRKRFGSNELALAAYNAGPGNVERYNGIPPFAETQNYVQDVMHFYRGYVETTRFVNAQNNI